MKVILQRQRLTSRAAKDRAQTWFGLAQTARPTTRSGAAQRAGRKLASILALSTALNGTAFAQTLTTTGPSLSSDTFQQIDANGVDVINGTYHIQAPALSAGGEANVVSAEMRWNGRMWELNIPSIWTDGDRNLFVNNGLRVDEFDFTSGVGWVPLRADGSTLDCIFWDSDRKVMSQCTYLSHDGIRIYFRAPSPQSVAPPNFSPALGNINANDALAAYPGGRIIRALGGYSGEINLHTNQGYGLRLTSSIDPNAGLYLLTDNEATSVISGGGIFEAVVTNLALSTPGISASTRNDKNVLHPKSTTQTMTDTLGRTWAFTFNSDGDMTGVRRPTSVGNDLTLGYNGDHQVTSFNNGVATWNYAYSSSGANGTTNITDPNGGYTVVTYVKKKGYARTIVDPLNRLTTYDYDNNSRVTSITYPELNSVGYTYDSRANITSKTTYPKPNSNLTPLTTQANYDLTCATPNNPTKCNLPNYIIDAKGNRTDITYNPWGQVLTITKPAPFIGAAQPQTRTTYSWLNTRVRNADGSIAVAYDQLSMPISTSECQTLASCDGLADEVKTTIDYGPLDNTHDNYLLPRTTSTGSGDGSLTAVVARAYDGRGNLITQDGPLLGTGDTTTYRYDAMRQQVGMILPDPDGGGPLKPIAMRQTYDAGGLVTLVESGNVTSAADADWSSFTTSERKAIAYDNLGRQIATGTAGTGATQTFTEMNYDALGRPLCTVTRMKLAAFPTIGANGILPSGNSACIADLTGPDGADRVTQNQYDAAGQNTAIVKAVGTSRAQNYAIYGYSPNGKQTQVIDANGNVATYVYDDFDRMIAWRFPAKANGTASATCTIGPVSEISGISGPTEARAGSDDCEKYSYDRNGNRAKLMKRDGQVIAYSFDALDRVTIKDIPGVTATDVYYDYDLRDLQLHARFGSSSGLGISHSYDALKRLITTGSNVDGTLRTLTYAYDTAGNRTRITHPDGNYFSYAYDNMSRPLAIQENGSAQVVAFAYDNQGYRVGDARGMVTTGYAYDPVSRLTGLSQNLTGSSADIGWTLTYTPASQIRTEYRDNEAYAFDKYMPGARGYAVNGLNQYTTADGANPTYDNNGNLTGDGTTGYTYDSENRLITASTGATLDYDPSGRLWQISNGSSVVRFLYDGDTLVEERDASGALLRRYVHGTGEDDPLLWYEGTGLTDRRSLQVDHLGSITSSADASGAVRTINSYDEYGTPGTNNDGRFQYTGQAWLPTLGLYYYKARMYSPKIGRFLQTDPIGYADQNNLYAYVGNDPVDGKDPTGMWNPWGHNILITKAFPGLSTRQIDILEKGSARADASKYQTGPNSYRHGMRSPSQSPQDARAQTQNFEDRLAALAKSDQGAAPTSTSDITDKSLNLFAFGAHAIMDSASPAHRDASGNPLPWSGHENWIEVTSHVLKETNPASYPANEQQAIDGMRAYFSKIYGPEALKQAMTPRSFLMGPVCYTFGFRC